MSELRMLSLAAAVTSLVAYYSIQFYRFAVEPAQAHTTERTMMVQACCIRGKAFTEIAGAFQRGPRGRVMHHALQILRFYPKAQIRQRAGIAQAVSCCSLFAGDRQLNGNDVDDLSIQCPRNDRARIY